MTFPPHGQHLIAGKWIAGDATFTSQPAHGPEFVAEAVRKWIGAVGAKTACIEPDRPLENGYLESFDARLREDLLSGEIF